jgi:hypothetical protein
LSQDYFVYPVGYVKPRNGDRVALIDGDGSNGVDNLALMKISAFEKRHGVDHVRLIKLKHQRKEGKLGLHRDSTEELAEIAGYDRIYASFIFTRSKPVIEILRTLLPTAFIGGTGADEYHEIREGDLRSQPKAITKMIPLFEEMYPDYALYENPEADANVAFWSGVGDYKLPKKARQVIEKSPNGYGITPIDLLENHGGSDRGIGANLETTATFNRLAAEYGMNDGKSWRGGTRGSGYSSTGCHRKCTFCVVPVIQGYINPMYYGLLGVINWVLPVGFYPTMKEVVELYNDNKLLMRPHVFRDSKGIIKRISSFLTISDNNFPADPTCLEKMDYMIANDITANLNQGMDARLLTAKKRTDKDGTQYPSGDDICTRLAKLRFSNFTGTAKQLHFSWDFLGVERAVMSGIDKLVSDYGLTYRNFTVYCLSGFNTTFEEDLERVMKLRAKRIDPFVMLFRNVDGSEGTKADGTTQDWRMKHLARWTNNKILFRATDFWNYGNYVREFAERQVRERDREAEYAAQIELFDWLTETYVNHA